MELKLRCTVSHGVGRNGGVREYSGDVTVDLHEHEIRTIKDVLGERGDDFERVEEELPDIFEKIERAAFNFKYYTFILDTCVHWSDEYGDVCEEDLIKEDLESGKFVPMYRNVEGASLDPLIMNQWFCWLVDSLKGLSYRERSEYLIGRYKMELGPCDEMEFEFSYQLA